MRNQSATEMLSATTPELDFDPVVNMGRQVLYRFAALSFLDPLAGAWEKLTALRNDPLVIEAAALMRGLQAAKPAELARGERPIEMLDPAVVLACLPDSRQALNIQYENTFGLLVSSNCPPYEMEYVNSKFTFQRSNTLADVSGFYRAFGLSVAETPPERHDHIVLELEFMACLLGLERGAAAADGGSAAQRRQICRDGQSRFFETHLAWWLPTFGELVARQNPNGFYAAAARFLGAFVATERALLGLPPASGRVAPTAEERPEFCEACELAT
jgi:TorA maturation chaperone TorD